MTLRRLGAVLLAGAVIAPLGRFAMVQSVDWTPVAIALPSSGVVTREFVVDKAGRYELAVRIDRPPVKSASDHAECRLGFDWLECAGDEHFLRLRWSVSTAGAERVVDRRSSGGRFTPALVERWVGSFDAGENASYVLNAETVSAPEDLRALNPRLLVLPSTTLDREQHSRTAAVWLASLLIGLAGAVLTDRAA